MTFGTLQPIGKIGYRLGCGLRLRLGLGMGHMGMNGLRRSRLRNGYHRWRQNRCYLNRLHSNIQLA